MIPKNIHAQRFSPLTGEPYPQCHCGRTVYGQGLCYEHFQLRTGAQALGKLGGQARAAALTPTRRSEIAAKASQARTTRKGWPKGRPRTPKAP